MSTLKLEEQREQAIAWLKAATFRLYGRTTPLTIEWDKEDYILSFQEFTIQEVYERGFTYWEVSIWKTVGGTRETPPDYVDAPIGTFQSLSAALAAVANAIWDEAKDNALADADNAMEESDD